MLKEFKEFAMKGNLVDMAVGFVEEAAPAEPPAPPRQEVLLEEIRNLLAKQS